MQDKKIRKVGDYTIINSIYIGDKELVLGVDMNNADGLFYFVADCERNDTLERYDNALIVNGSSPVQIPLTVNETPIIGRVSKTLKNRIRKRDELTDSKIVGSASNFV